ncbi:DUF4388 domain-containing protein [Haliangium ochraceum]|uniref:DUF4388 domain-containing protein n=1 Tax=Haliangium ochraceum TaxID=80816 RepID=UPI00019B9584|nr:DUF4388 domain-containing protein [Haliangium ochraceum]
MAEAVRFGFERAGARVSTCASADEAAAAFADASAVPRGGLEGEHEDGAAGSESADETRPPALIVTGATEVADALALLRSLRAGLAEHAPSVPVLCLAPRMLSRADALAAGASERLPQPAHLRDAVTLGRMLLGRNRRGDRAHVVQGHLSDYEGVFFLARALAAVGRSAVLSLVRGLRRGELRFHRGAITSAQVGALHGMAALHQLLLWSRAHFELRDEEVVPRRQIPLSASEILIDAERFLYDMRSLLGELTPAGVYAPAHERYRGQELPPQVRRVLRLIDGYRTMADVVEDSPYRVLETLAICNRLLALEWIVRVDDMDGERGASVGGGVSVERMLSDRLSESSSAAIGSVELESLSGDTKPMRMLRREASAFDDEDTADGRGGRASEVAGEPVDWSDVLPTEMASGFSPVVPATAAAGEIEAQQDDGVVRAFAPEHSGDEEDDSSALARGLRARTRSTRMQTAPHPDDGAEGEVELAWTPAAKAGKASKAGKAGRGGTTGRGEGASKRSPSAAPTRPADGAGDDDQRPSLWRRIFGRAEASASADDEAAPKAGGKPNRRGASRRRRKRR